MRPNFRFDDVVLDLEAFRLTRAGDPVHLEPKVLELLGYLVQNRGRLVEKPELQQAIWSDTAVSESALTRAVAQLRKALDDDAREARYVETVPTRGYRFRSEVSVEEGRTGTESPRPRGEEGPSASGPRRGGRWRVAVAILIAAMGVGLLVWTSRPLPPAARAAREVRRVQVSTTRGFNGFPTFSPDGSTLAFSSDRSGRLEIYMRSLAAGAQEVPVTSDGQDNVQPAWSPDGRFIAYHSQRRGGVWLIPALGGTPRQVTDFGSAPAWSPDGRRIAFSSLGLVAFEGIAQFGASLWVIDVDGAVPSAPRPLTEPGRPAAGHGPPVFMPDGSEVVFAADGLWAAATDGSLRVRQLVDGWVTDAAVSLDGRRVYWTGWEQGTWHVWSAAMPARGSVGDRAEVATTGDQAARHLRISRDGRLACGLVSLTSEIALLPLTTDGGAMGPVSEPVAGLTGRKLQLHFSPDGRTLAFARTQPGQALEVFGLDLRTGASRPLLPALANLGFLNGWFPQGDALLVTTRGGEDKSLARAPLGGERAQALVPVQRMGWARLLPPGREAVYHAVEGGVLNVRRAALDGSGDRALTDDGGGVGWPVPSPDGRTLAVEMFRGNDAQLGLLPAEGGTPRALTHVAGQHWGHDWSPDGKRVLYAARRDGLWNVYWMNVATGEERRLTDHARVRDAVRTPAWSPAGDRIAYERLETSSAVWVFELQQTPR